MNKHQAHNSNEQKRNNAEQLFKKYGSLMFIVAKSILHDDYEAEDAVMEAFRIQGLGETRTENPYYNSVKEALRLLYCGVICGLPANYMLKWVCNFRLRKSKAGLVDNAAGFL